MPVGKLLMDLSHRGQSRDAEGRHRAARPGLGTWVGARVASPRCPILRPGPFSVLRAAAIRQFTVGSPSHEPGRKKSPGTASPGTDRVPRPSSRGGWSARRGIRFVLFSCYQIILSLPKGGMSAMGSRSSEATDLSGHLLQDRPSRPSGSAHRSIEGHGQR